MTKVTKKMGEAGAVVLIGAKFLESQTGETKSELAIAIDAMTAAQDTHSKEWWCPICERGVDRGWNGDQNCEDCGGRPIRLAPAQDTESDGSIVDLLEDALNYSCECGTPTGEMAGCKHCSLTTTAYGEIRRLEAAVQDETVQVDNGGRVRDTRIQTWAVTNVADGAVKIEINGHTLAPNEVMDLLEGIYEPVRPIYDDMGEPLDLKQ